MDAGITILRAEARDLPEILALQRLAYQSEAVLLNNFSIPPLRETLQEAEEQYRTGTFLKAVSPGGVIAGSVRARAENGTLHIGKLMVHPEWQGRGLGGRLLAAMEEACPEPRYELFTSTLSARNLTLYERRGYRRFAEKEAGPGLRLVYLEKLRSS